jgi:hypothetical protein
MLGQDVRITGCSRLLKNKKDAASQLTADFDSSQVNPGARPNCPARPVLAI